MNKQSKKSVTFAAATLLGLSLLTVDSNAQGRYDRHDHHGADVAPWRGPSNPYSGQSRGRHANPQVHQNHYLLRQIDEKIYLIDQLADQMARQYGIEVRRYRGCSCSIALNRAIQLQARLTDNLVSASRGTCAVTFERAACAVGDNFENIEKLQKGAQISSCVRDLISRSCAPTTFVHDNRDKWIPKSQRFSRGRDHGHYTHRAPVNENPFAFILSRFLNVADW